jgi:putative hydrolase of the HAD superfamily
MTSTIKAVVFDFGNVISLPPPPEAREEMALMAGIPAETLAGLDRKHRKDYDRGNFDGKGYYKFLLSTAGIFLDDPVLEKIAGIDSEGWKHINTGTVDLARDIKKLGFALGILSNMPYDFLAWARKHIPLFTGADAAVFSCEVNVIKPEPAIYGELKKRLDCEYGEIVFFDDLPDNISAAQALGIKGFIWDGPEAARAALKKIEPRFAGL